ncbi:DNA polymerase III subunit alpha [[Mycoplasma] anseris]|uniref:DNA-directed DNA polymerase n=1 Tax=[Mycoplasma] anseris TaxID=92400 RepID=A0A2Z4NDD0_9BACT|nr:DNA polymerase III subunit alpha [[Mycoplasma] anseris]AWX69537.1 DNA polymerase III subunit alpha [[Mycoplasma] anseris]
MKLINGHLNTTFSFLESVITTEKLFEILKQQNVEYFVVSEHNNMFSYGEILNKCFNTNLKPIFALDCELYVDNKPYRYIVYAKNKNGFMDLKKLSYELLSQKAIKVDDIWNNEDLLFVEHPILGVYKQTNKIIQHFNYYYSFQSFDLENNQAFIQQNWSKVLLINHNAIIDIEENNIMKVLFSMSEKAPITSFFEPLVFNIENNLQIYNELISQTNNFLKSLYIPLEQNNYFLPKFENNLNMSSSEYLDYLLKENIVKKFNKSSWTIEYVKRLEYELQIIKSLNFEDYFLIIQDWINWAKSKNISIGPGRGSAAGSLVSYILGITTIDPIKYNLIFERFLNPKRITMPDIDVDVQDNRREEVIEYLIQKYGFSRVANIVTFATLGKKSAIRDVLRAYKVNPSSINDISKSISSKDIDLLEEFHSNKRFANELNKISNLDFELPQRVLKEANKLEGFYRQTGTHAAGIVISSDSIIKKIPTYLVENHIQQTQISMEYLESFGLLKMDILSLKTLTTIQEILNLIKVQRGIELDLETIAYDDKKTFELLTKGKTIGVFQLESYGMNNALRQIKVNSFDDIVAIISLYRPGPMEHLKTYAERKNRKIKIESISKEFDAIVASTYGIIIYQEQIMEIVQKIAGFDYAEADMIRRIISKKKFEEMIEQKTKFVNAAIKNGYDETKANQIFESIEAFADYGFNKSHAVSYAKISYQMAYLKTHYPLEFFASIISSAHGNQDTISRFVNEAKELNIEVLPPTINDSEDKAIIKDNKIILPLNMIKGFGPETTKMLVHERKTNGKYLNFFHFLLRTQNLKSFGLSSIELLIKANALKEFKLNQKTMLSEISKDNSDTLIILKMFINKIDSKETQEMINNYKPTEILKSDIEEENQNEINLLGQIYNFSITENYEIEGSRLGDMHNNVEYLTTLFCNRISEKTSAYGKPYYVIELQDSTKKITILNYSKIDNWKEFDKKIVKVKIIKKDESKYLLKEWSVING